MQKHTHKKPTKLHNHSHNSQSTTTINHPPPPPWQPSTATLNLTHNKNPRQQQQTHHGKPPQKQTYHIGLLHHDLPRPRPTKTQTNNPPSRRYQIWLKTAVIEPTTRDHQTTTHNGPQLPYHNHRWPTITEPQPSTDHNCRTITIDRLQSPNHGREKRGERSERGKRKTEIRKRDVGAE